MDVRSAFHAFNLGLAFVLELAALAPFGLWGSRVAPSPGLRVLYAVGLPVLAGLLWGLLASPRARWSSAPGAWLFPYVYFVVAAAALAAVGAPALGVLLLMLALLNRLALAGRTEPT